MCPSGDVDTMLQTLIDLLSVGPYVLGERFPAADVLWGTALTWMTNLKLVPELPPIMAYIGRVGWIPICPVWSAEGGKRIFAFRPSGTVKPYESFITWDMGKFGSEDGARLNRPEPAVQSTTAWVRVQGSIVADDRVPRRGVTAASTP